MVPEVWVKFGPVQRPKKIHIQRGCPAEIWISLYSPKICWEPALSPWYISGLLAFLTVKDNDQEDCINPQTDLNLKWADMCKGLVSGDIATCIVDKCVGVSSIELRHTKKGA